MSALKIDLSAHTDKFVEDSRELVINKKVNFIFGKNGTGKTTIADEVLKQFSEQYNICVFKDFDGVAENDRLNAVALGTENTKIQSQIEAINSDIKDIKKEIELPAEKSVQNFFTKSAIAKKNFDDKEKIIDPYWANKRGWEYDVLMLALAAVVTVFGPGKFTLLTIL